MKQVTTSRSGRGPRAKWPSKVNVERVRAAMKKLRPPVPRAEKKPARRER